MSALPPSWDADEAPTGSVLVTGASGVIGTATVDLLRTRGYDVTAVTSADADLRDPRATETLLQDLVPEFVIHLAARVGGLMGNAHSQAQMYLENIRINTNVIEAAHNAGVRKIVAMGSVAAYPEGLDLPMRETDIWRGAPHASEAGYAHAKRSMLAQLEAYNSQYGMDYAFALSTNLFGPSDKFDESGGHVLPSLISKFHRAITQGTSVTVWGSGASTRDFLFSRDAADALVVLLRDGSGVFNVASGRQVTIREVVEELARVTAFDGEILWDPSKPDGQLRRSYDVSRLSSLGWTAKTPLSVALGETFQWFAENVANARR